MRALPQVRFAVWYPKDNKTFPHHLEEDHVEVEAEPPHPSLLLQLQCGGSVAAAGPPPPRPHAAQTWWQNDVWGWEMRWRHPQKTLMCRIDFKLT